MIGRRLRQLREAQGMTQTELAERVGVSQSHISDVELNQRMPSMRILVKLAESLGVGVGDLFNGGKEAQQ